MGLNIYRIYIHTYLFFNIIDIINDVLHTSNKIIGANAPISTIILYNIINNIKKKIDAKKHQKKNK